MRSLLFFLSVIVAGAIGAAEILAQSKSGQPGSSEKANSRPVTTPTPQKQSVSEAAIVAPDDTDVIRVNTQLVSVPVRVMDKKGRFIGGLGREDFSVFEDGVEQQIELFSNEHQPFTVALVIDMSYSTTFKISEIQSAAIAFIDQLRPQDKVMVVSFDAEVHLLCEATSDRKEIFRAIKSTKVSTGTSLYEAVDLVMNNRLREIEGRKAIILFTDGVDTTSRRAHDLSNLTDAMELDALIYPIRYDTFADVQRMKGGAGIPLPPPIMVPTPTSTGTKLPDLIKTLPTTPSVQGTTEAEYQRAAEYLDQLASRTGGRLYEATTVGNLADAYSKIASELREFYSIGYYPKEERIAGKNARVKVKVDRDGVVVRARETFIRRKSPR